MNKQRRAEIASAIQLLNRADELLKQAADLIETAKDDERDYYDNMPESLQSGEKGEAASAAADLLDAAFDDLLAFEVEAIVAQLEEASQ